MNFDLTAEQSALADSVNRFCAQDYGFEARNKLIDTQLGFDPANWRTFAELGWLGAGLSEEAGGFGGGPVENMVIMEAFGRALVLEPFLPTAILSLQTLAALPGGEKRDQLIEAAISGEMRLAFAHGEAAGRGDEHFVEARFDGQTITGAKSLIFGAPSADRLLVSARGEAGIGLYLVDPAARGLNATPYRLLDNSRAADLVFENVPAEAVLAPAGEVAEAAIATGHAHALVAICAEAVGAMDASILLTRDYLKTRKQFGTTLNNFQALQHRMADMLVEMELSRSILYQGIAALAGKPDQRDHALSAMKAIVSTAATFIGRNAIQLHGGIGMTEEYSIGHYYRRLFVIASQFGGESLHLKRMAAAPRPFWSDDFA